MSQTTPLTLDEFPPVSYEEWRSEAIESLKGAPFEKKLITRTHEGIDLQPIYNASDLEALKLPENWPGLPPYLRGRRPAPDLVEPWLIAQEIPLGDPVAFNRAALHDLMRGRNALTILLDGATRRGLNPADVAPLDVGQCGLSVVFLSDLETALDGICLDAIPVLAWCGPSNLA
ncbi:MAG: acyl-CoA mutase large subunit family protein, partial [Chthoniobacterales bacterium]|nr:acyl-CoA mutase large subunit family protein [Chthoniobacterales bacterium]